MPAPDRLLFLLLVLTLLGNPRIAGAQTRAAATSAPSLSPGPVIDEPAAPVAPEVISRDNAGHATVRAVRLDHAMTVDGNLDEPVYESVPAIGGFLQQEPHFGEPATERTDVWIFFDDTTLYISARCWDDHPERWVLSGLERDSGSITDSENFVAMLDTFHDRRNGLFFQTNPMGGYKDQAVTDAGSGLNPNWNPVWKVRSGRFAGGWSLEMAIPFKSLRYRGSGPQTWGINFRRVIRWKNERAFLTKVPAQFGVAGIGHLEVAATLVGLETPAQSLNLELKPYAVSSLTTDHAAAAPYSNKLSGDWGADFKYGLTRGLITDFTYNTDFAQVEEDLQQVNLTRFNLLFPEKREFFLEGQGIFAFGGASAAGGGGGGDIPVLFFSRQIGFFSKSGSSQGAAVPVIGGGRLTGKAGRYDIGLLDMVTDDEPTAGAVKTNFSVLRVKRGILRQSYMGVIATRRSNSISGTGDNMTMGADLGLVLSRTLAITSYYARTRTQGLTGDDDASYRANFNYASDRYGFSVEQLKVGKTFTPEVGFLRRSDFRRNSASLRFSPRPKGNKMIRKLSWDGGFDYVTNAGGEFLQTQTAHGNFSVELQNGDLWNARYTGDFEGFEKPLRISSIVIPVGGYHFNTFQSAYDFGNQRKISGTLNVATGSFYGGTRTDLGFSGARVRVTKHLEFEPGVTMNWVSTPYGNFDTRLVTTRILVMPTPRMVISSLIQYNSSNNSLSSSLRLRWEYTSGSEMFLVYSEGRATPGGGFPEITNRSLAIKLTRLFRF